MKKSLALLYFFILTVGGVFAQGIEFFHGTYEEALQKARAEGKQIFVDVYTSWCGPCKMMAKNVFTRQEVGDYYNSKFVCLKLDAEKESGHAFFQRYRANGYPSFFWLDAQGNLLETRTGSASPEDFIRYAEEAVGSDFSVRLEAARKRWESGERSLELVEEYVIGLLRRVQPDQVKGCLLSYFSTLTEEQLQQKENYSLMRGFMRFPEDNIVFHSLTQYADIYQGYEKGNDFWVNMYRMMVRAGSANIKEPEKYRAHIEMIRKTESFYAPMYLEILDMERMLFEKNFKKGMASLRKVADKYSDKHPYLYGQFFYTLIIAGFFDDTVTDPEWIEQAIGIAGKALEHTPSKETLLYLAAAHAKKGNYKKAYELMASEPFFPAPVLSTALYPHLHLQAIHRQYLDKK